MPTNLPNNKYEDDDVLVVMNKPSGYFWIVMAMTGVAWNLYFLYNLIEAWSQTIYLD
jgi:hypothetical protein